MPSAMLMSAADTGLLIIDVQEKLLPLIPDNTRLVMNIAFLIDGARLLGLPVLATEQYPKGLGITVAELAKRLPKREPKVAFTSCAVPTLVQEFRQAGRPKVMLAGIETHVCVMQTALDLIVQDFQVYVAADAVASRHAIDHEQALARMERAGCTITTSEAALFEWTKTAADPRFKEVSRLVQERMKALQ
jgi:nicotinamidase-related amidase